MNDSIPSLSHVEDWEGAPNVPGHASFLQRWNYTWKKLKSVEFLCKETKHLGAEAKWQLSALCW